MELKELGLPDRVLTMGWCGDSICLGFHRECALVPTAPLYNALNWACSNPNC